MPPAQQVGRGGILESACPCVRPSVCRSVGPSVGWILVDATPPIVFHGWLSNFPQWLDMMCRCAWRQEFWIPQVLSELWPFVIFTHMLYSIYIVYNDITFLLIQMLWRGVFQFAYGDSSSYKSAVLILRGLDQGWIKLFLVSSGFQTW